MIYGHAGYYHVFCHAVTYLKYINLECSSVSVTETKVPMVLLYLKLGKALYSRIGDSLPNVA